MNFTKKIERWWKFSIFGRNSRILKVLAHEISDEIPKQLIFFILMVWWREVIITFSQYELHEKNWVLVEVFDFWSKFSISKGVSPRNKWRNPKKITIFDFNGMTYGGNNYCFSVETSWKNLSGRESFQFFCRNFSNFKVVNPRNKSRNSKKKMKFLILMVWWREVVIIFSQYELYEKNWAVVEVFNFWSKFSNFKGVSPRNKWRNPKKKYFQF